MGKMDVAWSSVYAPFAALFKTNPAQDRLALMETMYTRVLTELCVNRFKWTGLEDTGIDVRWMELCLFRYGLSVVYKHEATGKIIAVQGAPSGVRNWSDNPTAYTVVGNLLSGNKQLKWSEVVPVWANALRMPDLDVVYIYAKKLAEIDRSIEINSDNARMPTIIAVNENQRLSAQNINDMIRKGESVITLNSDAYQGGGLGDIITAFNRGVHPDMIEKLHIVRTRLWGECMGLLGFDFANQDKKERLVASEVDANNSQVDGMRMVNLNARKYAAEQMSKRFGLTVDVEYHITSEMSAAKPVPGVVPDSTNIAMSDGAQS